MGGIPTFCSLLFYQVCLWVADHNLHRDHELGTIAIQNLYLAQSVMGGHFKFRLWLFGAQAKGNDL